MKSPVTRTVTGLVSILAPLARGALHAQQRRSHQDDRVSILAPLARGALPPFAKNAGVSIKFQSSPLSQEGRYIRPMFLASRPAGFNPRPSRKRGATDNILAFFFLDRRFNPRPSRKRGATADYVAKTEQRLVSILAPLARGALPDTRGRRVLAAPFQSSPLSQEGRYHRLECDGRIKMGFNPRPSRKRGAT